MKFFQIILFTVLIILLQLTNRYLSNVIDNNAVKDAKQGIDGESLLIQKPKLRYPGKNNLKYHHFLYLNRNSIKTHFMQNSIENSSIGKDFASSKTVDKNLNVSDLDSLVITIKNKKKRNVRDALSSKDFLAVLGDQNINIIGKKIRQTRNENSPWAVETTSIHQIKNKNVKNDITEMLFSRPAKINANNFSYPNYDSDIVNLSFYSTSNKKINTAQKKITNSTEREKRNIYPRRNSHSRATSKKIKNNFVEPFANTTQALTAKNLANETYLSEIIGNESKIVTVSRSYSDNTYKINYTSPFQIITKNKTETSFKKTPNENVEGISQNSEQLEQSIKEDWENRIITNIVFRKDFSDNINFPNATYAQRESNPSNNEFIKNATDPKLKHQEKRVWGLKNATQTIFNSTKKEQWNITNEDNTILNNQTNLNLESFINKKNNIRNDTNTLIKVFKDNEHHEIKKIYQMSHMKATKIKIGAKNKS